MRRLSLAARLLQFRTELVLLWRGFFDPATPLHLKAAMLGVLAYLISPIDLIPEFLPILGIVDDLVLVPLLVAWIARRLPGARRSGTDGRDGNKVIEGEYRQL